VTLTNPILYNNPAKRVVLEQDGTETVFGLDELMMG
jgi:hypothetical protein